MIDTHTHLDVEAFDADREAVLERSVAAGVTTWIVPAVEPTVTRRSLRAPWRRPEIHFAAGIHPHEAARLGTTAIQEVETILLEHPEIVAIGEAGLDYFYHPEEMERQKLLFDAQINLARRYDRPLIVHIRNGKEGNENAYRDALELIRGRSVRGVLHSFTGTYEVAAEALDAGWIIGLNGILTFKQSQALREVAARLPLDRILIETDCPYLAPTPFRGKRNEPSCIPTILAILSELHKKELAETSKTTTTNARLFFRLT